VYPHPVCSRFLLCLCSVVVVVHTVLYIVCDQCSM
jgi:hypothetical protein